MSGGRGFQTLVAAGLIAAFGGGAASAQDAARGDAVFQHMCAPCHGDGVGDDGRAMLPGTAALSIKYGGEVPALLEERSDLTEDVLKLFLRQGSWSMPPFRPTELTDADIADIAAHLAESSARAADAQD